jgi:hypothetical protein
MENNLCATSAQTFKRKLIMAMTINGHGIPAIGSYEDALRVWEENIKLAPRREQFRGNVRLLDKRKGDTLKIVKYADDSIGCRYHDLDVVTYHPDGSVGVDGYESVSTNVVMRAVMPDGMEPDMMNCLGTLVHCRRGDPDNYFHHSWDDAEVYFADGTYRRNDKGEWENTTIKGNIQVYSVDQAKLRAFKKEHRVSEFLTWAKMYVQHKGSQAVIVGERIMARDVALSLLNQEAWPDLVRLYGVTHGRKYYRPKPWTLEEGIHYAMLCASGAVSYECVNSIKLSDMERVKRNYRKYAARGCTPSTWLGA